MNNPSVGVVIVTYNSEKFIQSCISSIKLNKYTNLKIVVCDNASSDNTVYLVKKIFPEVHVIISKKNLGFGAGNNKGIRYLLGLKCSYITLINPDTKIKPNLLQKLVNVFYADKMVGVASPIITYMNDPNIIWFAGGYFNSLFCYTKHLNMNKKLNECNINSGNVGFLTGACMMVKSEVFNIVGLLPEQYFLYFEDVFYCQKVILNKYSTFLLAEALSSHNVSSTTGKAGTNEMTPLKAYYFARNPIIYINNEVNNLLKITNYIGQFAIRFPFYLFQFIRDKNFHSFYSYILGIYDGFVGGKRQI